MLRQLSLVSLLLVGMAVGCRPKVQPAPPPPRVQPASARDVDALRIQYRSHYPNSEVGQIVAARPQDQLVAVGGADSSRMAVDQVVTFIDANQTTLATGRVVRIVEGVIHCRYDTPIGPHEPAVGDIMIRF